MDDYEFITKIGSGSFGSVYKIFDHKKNKYRAVKKFKKLYNTVKDCHEEIEVEVLPKLKHPNIVRLDKIIYQNEMLYLVMELAKTDLARHFTQLRNDGAKLTEEQIRKMMKQIISGVQVSKSK